MINKEKLFFTALSLLSLKTSRPFINKIVSGIGLSDEEKSFILNNFNLAHHLKVSYNDNAGNSAAEIIDFCVSNGYHVIEYSSIDYPPLLREIQNPPMVLYVTGKINLSQCIAIVGTRKSDYISEKISHKLSSELCDYGFTIVSGMAEGIDRAAHIGALNRGATAGVVAGGIDAHCPSSNSDIFKRITESGNSTLLSENPPGSQYYKWAFVQRNRIISGISKAVVVVKAQIKSGAMITARYAIEQNRELFACPGYSFDDSYSGCGRLIQQGANILTCTEDILNELNILYPKQKADIIPDKKIINPYPEDSLEHGIINTIMTKSTDTDSLSRLYNKHISEVNNALTILEMDGIVRRNGNLVLYRDQTL